MLLNTSFLFHSNSSRRYNNIGALKKAVDAVKFDPGWTMTAEAMVDSLKFFQKDMRQDPYTTKVFFYMLDAHSLEFPPNTVELHLSAFQGTEQNYSL